MSFSSSVRPPLTYEPSPIVQEPATQLRLDDAVEILVEAISPNAAVERKRIGALDFGYARVLAPGSCEMGFGTLAFVVLG